MSVSLCLHGAHVCLSYTFPWGETLQVHTDGHRTAHMGSVFMFLPMHQTTVSQPVPHNHSHPTSHRVLAKGMAWETQNDSFTQTHCHPGSRHMTTTIKRQPQDHNHTGDSHTTTAT